MSYSTVKRLRPIADTLRVEGERPARSAEHPEPMNRHLRHARRASLLSGLALFVALGAAPPASAARVVKVRVGTHAEFTRVVFELDASAGYRVERIGGDDHPALRVTVEAASEAHKLRSSGDIATVRVDAGANALAHVALRKPGLRVQEMILSNPPRIVLDVMRAEPSPELAAAPSAKKPASQPEAAAVHPAITPPLQPERRPAPPPLAKSEAKPAEAKPTLEKPAGSKPPDTKTAAVKPGVEKPAAEAKPAPEAKPVEKPAEVKAAEVKPGAAPPAVPPLTPAITPPRPPEAAASKVAPAPAPATPALTPAITPPRPPEPALQGSPAAVDPKLAPAPLPGPQPLPREDQRKRPTATPVPPASDAKTGWLDRPSGAPLWIGGLAGGLVLVALGVVLYRRNRPLPNDLDVIAIAEESGAPAAEGLEWGGAASASRATAAQDNPLGGLFDVSTPAPPPRREMPRSALADFPIPAPASGPSPRGEANRPARSPLGREAAAQRGEAERSSREGVQPSEDRTVLPSGDRPGVEPAAMSSLFDDDDIVFEDASRGDAPMTDMDLPTDRSSQPSPPPPMGRSAAPAPDVTRMLQDLERRISTLESKLDESNEAREKLERQVAAQSEELRVQRAAIARTQRALRTMSHTDEDKATEPALRGGDTQTKTRVV